ncbi:unnamed protein product [Prunus armeniaca]
MESLEELYLDGSAMRELPLVIKKPQTVGDLSSQHLLVSYLPRDDPYRLSFDGNFGSKKLETSSFIKKCRARVVYKRDLEEFSRILKIPMPAVYGYDDEAGPIDSGSGSSDNDDEPISKRFKKV